MQANRQQSRPARRRVPTAAAVIAGLSVLVVVSAGVWGFIRGRAGRSPRVEPVADGPVAAAPKPTQPVSFEQGCVSAACHAGYLEADVVHAPVAAGACETCHSPDTGGHEYPVAAPSAACSTCHDIGAGGVFRHAAMTEDGCLACHNPHVSDRRGLLKRPTIGAVCVGCHVETPGAVRHRPYDEGGCTLCHDVHGENDRLLLRGAVVSDDCALCHGVIAGIARNGLHGFGGDCLTCHDGHAGGWPGLLVEDPESLCLRCHEDIGETIDSAVVTHPGARPGGRCVSCHDPHTSSADAMLRDNQAAVCLSCHGKPVEAADGRTIPDMTPLVESAEHRHGPVDHGRCSLCHSVHGSANPRLLRGKNPGLMLGGFDTRNYSLCFSCHDAALVTEAESVAVTAFRNGSQNLHNVHVLNRGRARSCSACHVVHGGRLPRLMAESVPYEGSPWKMPLGFVLTVRGGRCAPGCHEPMSYDRGAGGRQ